MIFIEFAFYFASHPFLLQKLVQNNIQIFDLDKQEKEIKHKQCRKLQSTLDLEFCVESLDMIQLYNIVPSKDRESASTANTANPETKGTRKNSQLRTILTLVNLMLGSAMLTFPIQFKKSGIISSSIVLLLSAIISFTTCRIYVFHCSQGDKDIESTIRRVLGRSWQKNFRLITGAYLILLNIINFNLIVDQIYSILYFFFQHFGFSQFIAEKHQFHFKKFNIQWLTLMLFAPLLALTYVKKIAVLIKLSGMGSISAFVYITYVIIQFFISAFNTGIHFSGITWFSFDAVYLAGTCGLAFSIQNVIITFTKQNQEQENNINDLKAVYTLDFMIYAVLAVFGALAITDKDCTNTFINCYLSNWTILFVEVGYLFSRLTVFPCVLEVGRTRLLKTFVDNVKDYHLKLFNFGFVFVGAIFSMFSPYVPISMLMNLVGSIVCYFFIYLIPTKLHLECLYGRKSKPKDGLDTMIQNGQENSQCSHDQVYLNSSTELFRRLFYGGVNLIGLGIAALGLYLTIVRKE